MSRTVQHISLRQRIIGGFAVLLMLLSACAIVSNVGLFSLGKSAETASRATDAADAASAFTRSLLLVRRNNLAFVRFEATEDLLATLKSFEQASADAVQLDASIGDPAKPIQTALARYRETFQNQIDESKAKQVAQVQVIREGDDLSTTAHAIAHHLMITGDPALPAAVRFYESLQHLLVFNARFFALHAESDAEIVSVEVPRAQREFAALKAALGPDLVPEGWIASSSQRLAKLSDAASRVVDYTVKLDNSVKRATALGNELNAKVEKMRSEAVQVQRATVAGTQATVGRVFQLVLWLAISTVASGIAIAIGVTLSITRPLARITIVMTDLAHGKLDTDVPGRAANNEIGAIARAVQTFKEAGLAKLRLEAEQEESRRQAEAERAEREAQRAAAAEAQDKVITALGAGLGHLAEGDLTYRLDVAFLPDYERLRTDFNGALDQLHQLVDGIATNAGAIQSGTGEIAQAADDLSRRTEQQAASLEQTAAALQEITKSVDRTAAGAKHACEVVLASKTDAEQSGFVVRNAVTAMTGIERSSEKIGQIISVIDEIAFQTNLLALNAGVEAARAGDAGRGFAVVASEVRALAQRSADAAREIKSLISTSAQQVDAGVKLVGETGQALARIIVQVGEVAGVVSGIASAAGEESASLQQVNTAVNQMDQVTQQNAAMVEQSTAASHHLAREAEELTRLTSQFTLSGNDKAAAAGTSRMVRPSSRNTGRSPGKPAARLKPAPSGHGASAGRG